VKACALVVVFACCGSYAQYAEGRRAEVLAAYPPGTARDDIHTRIAHEPDVMETKPASGWSTGWIQEHVDSSQKRTGKRVWTVERYSLPGCGSSSPLSLCREWFYYDQTERVVDVDWEYRSD
jgi:hypothetical protein